MQNVINIYKPVGMTPLQLIEAFKKDNPEHNDLKIAYAGRLDPMAHGVMILLVDPETKNRSAYQDMDKTYEFEVLLGVSSDTYDIMGIGEIVDPRCQITDEKLKNYLKKIAGKKSQEYPPYSSKTVGGKPLYYWARKGKLEEIEIPDKEIEVYEAKLIETSSISSENLIKLVRDRVNLVKGNFRQEEILEKWNAILNKNMAFQTVKIEVTCSSGTYVRSIANEMGNYFKTGALALDIKRICVGDYRIEDTIKL